METLEEIRGYFFGVLLGDGHIRWSEYALEQREKTGGKNGPLLDLKVIDREFAQKWASCIGYLTGRTPAVSEVKMENPNHRTQYKVRSQNFDLVQECEILTRHKTIIPGEVTRDYSDAGLRAFVTGLMDSEGWLNVALSSLGQCDLTLGFGCGDPWFFDFLKILERLKVRTSKVYNRPIKAKKNGEPGREFRLVRLHIQDYVNAGLSFSIRRKADRLAFVSRILNDYMRDYPRYKDYFG